MNKLFKLFLCSATLVLALTASAWAFPVNPGDIIYFDKTYGTTNGGQFDVSLNDSAPYLFGTFCLERNEYLNLSDGFRVAGISDAARNGGTGGAINGEDPLAETTKWLYWHFAKGDLDSKVAGYSYNDAGGADALQRAIWFLEQEISSVSDLLALKLITAAELALNGGGFTEGRVAVINLEYLNGCKAQDQLVAAPVPEPGTLLLVGLGLTGLALVRRRSKR